MPGMVRCPNCSRGYSLDERLFGRTVKCTSCGHEFRVSKPDSPAAPVQPPAAGTLPQTSPGLGDLLDESLPALGVGGDLSSLGPLQSGPTLGHPTRTGHRRRTGLQMTASDKALRTIGGAIVGFSFGFAVVAGLRGAWLAIAVGFSLVGAVLLAYSIRRNRVKFAVVCILIVFALACLALIPFLGDGKGGSSAGTAQRGSKDFDDLTDQVLANLSEMADAVASTKDAGSSAATRQRMAGLTEKLLAAMEERKRLDQRRVIPEDKQKAAEFPARLRQVGVKLREALLRVEDRFAYTAIEQQLAALQNKVEAIRGQISLVIDPSDGIKRPNFPQELGTHLFQFHTAYERYCDVKNEAPRSWDELLAFAQSDMQLGTYVPKIQQWRATNPVVLWGTHRRDLRLSEYHWLLAYNQDAPHSGGYYLMFEGISKYVTARELQDILLAMTLASARLRPEEVQATMKAKPPEIAGRNAPAQAQMDPRLKALIERSQAEMDRRRPSAKASPEQGPPAPPDPEGVGPPFAGPMQGAGPGFRPPVMPGSRDFGGRSPVGPMMPPGAGPVMPQGVGPRLPPRAGPMMPPSVGPMMPPGMDSPQPGDTELVGGVGGSPFRKVQPGGLLLGVRYALGSWAGIEALGAVEPIFRREEAGPTQASLAKEGYAVGAMNVQADQYVLAVQLVFMRLAQDGRLDPKDTYTSPWLGKPSGRPAKTLSGNGKRVIGVRGRGAAVMDAIGLVTE